MEAQMNEKISNLSSSQKKRLILFVKGMTGGQTWLSK